MTAVVRVGAGAQRARWLVLGVLASAVLGGAGCEKLAALAKKPQPAVFNRPRVDAALWRMLEKVQDDPKFKEVLAKGPQGPKGEKLGLAVTSSSAAGEIGAQLGAKGIARLSPEQFLEVVRLKLKLADKSPKLCAGFWSGGIATADLAEGLDALNDADLERWFDAAAQAAHLELYATTPLPRFKGQVLVEGMRDIAASLSPAESEAFLNTAKQGPSAPPAAACQAFLQLSHGGLAFPDPRRDQFLRALAFDKLVDW
jgi:hypothetical protein